ncbi:MAG: FkbM family methyltransferase [Xanthobacteraceae bacterium]
MDQTQFAGPATSSWLAGLNAAHGLDGLRDAMQDHTRALDVGNLQSLAIVGAAPEGRRLAQICRARGITIAAIVDDDPAKAGLVVEGVTIAPVQTLANLARSTPVVIASHRVLRATERLRRLGFTTVVPFAMLQVLAPELFPPHMFYDALLDDLWTHRSEVQALHDRLADDRSREVLEAVVGFRRTLDPAMLRPVLTEHDLYAPDGLFEFGDDEVYVDAGSYDGDTIRSFISRVDGRFADIYAFEPDPVTFEKLRANFRDEPRVHPFHAGLHSHGGSLRFRDDASRGAIFAADGEIEMPVTTIDDVLGDRRLTYIKMNIEGAEIEALKGGRKAIGKWRPRLAISVYHRASDLWRLPQLVLELNPDYRLYLRQHDGGIIETVLYALPA